MRKSILFFIFICFLGSNAFSSNITVNNKFPDFQLTSSYLTNSEKSYLKINNDVFTISDIKSKYVFVEFLNIYCFACQKQAPIYNKLYERVKKLNVKFIGIALGNSSREVINFKKAHNIKFPVIPDNGFKIYKLIGGTRTPFTVIVKNKKVIYTHLGLNINFLKFVENFKNDSFTVKAEGEENFEELKISQKEILLKIKNEIKNIKTFEKKDKFYKITTDNNQIFYASVISSKSVCNICHPMAFIYIVNREGIITNFISVHLTKRRNRDWNQKEIKKIKKHIVGKSIFTNFEFNKNIDAVTSATITSSMIFFYLNNGKNIFKLLK